MSNERVGYLTKEQFVSDISGSVGTSLSGTFQPLNATLTNLSSRLIGAANSTDILDRASGDGRYALSSSAVVTSFNTRTGSVTLSSTDVTTALGYTPTSVTSLTGAQTVAGFKTGLSLVKADVGLSSVDNTSDATKNVLSATKLTTARTINGVSFDGSANITVNAVDATAREPAITAGTTAQYWRGDKSWQTLDKTAVGLGSVDNTADAAKAVLSATKLTTARNINGVSFDGTAAITINAVDSTARVPATRTISTTAPLAGGGDLSADRTLSIVAASASVPGSMSAADFSKLAGVASGATANSSDAILLARANHTGTQSPSTILTAAASVLIGRYAATSGTAQEITLGSGLTLNSSTGVLSAAGSGGTITSFAFTNGGGFTGTVTNPTTTPNLALTLDANGVTLSKLTAASAASILGATAAGNAAYLTPAQAKTVLSIAAADVSGLAATATSTDAANLTGTLSAARLPAFTGDATSSAGASALTLATVNANTGSIGSATQSLTLNLDGKGRILSASAQTVTPAFSSLTSKPTTLSGYGITDAQGLNANLTAYAGAAWSTGVQVATLTAANTVTLKTVGSATGNILDKAAGDALYLGIAATSAASTKLVTARTINGVSFDGTANITINAVDSTARVPATRTISTTAPLTGGGDLSADRTLAISAATSSVAGSMSAADKAKLDALDDAWVSYTPTLAATGGGAFGSATAAGWYKKLGTKTYAIRVKIDITTVGTANSYFTVTAPFTSRGGIGVQPFVGRENGATGYTVNGALNPGDTLIYVQKYDGTFIGGNGYSITVQGIYEIA